MTVIETDYKICLSRGGNEQATEMLSEPPAQPVLVRSRRYYHRKWWLVTGVSWVMKEIC